MNNSLRQNWKIFNNIKFHPLGDLEESAPRDKREAAEWANQIWTHLVNDNIERCLIYVRKRRRFDKYNITVWNDGEVVYLVVCSRTEYNTDSTVVYMQPYTEDNLNDFKALAKFIHTNIVGITNTSVNAYKSLNQLIEGKINAKA